MATRARSTRTSLLRLPVEVPPLLGCGLGRQPGPVTIALAAMQAADPDRQRIRELCRRIAARIEADLALLDALSGDPDLEDGADAEPSLCGIGSHERGGNAHSLPVFGGPCGEHTYDLEQEDEHGGDINDEPHDPEEDGCAAEDVGHWLFAFDGTKYVSPNRWRRT